MYNYKTILQNIILHKQIKQILFEQRYKYNYIKLKVDKFSTKNCLLQIALFKYNCFTKHTSFGEIYNIHSYFVLFMYCFSSTICFIA